MTGSSSYLNSSREQELLGPVGPAAPVEEPSAEPPLEQLVDPSAVAELMVQRVVRHLRQAEQEPAQAPVVELALLQEAAVELVPSSLLPSVRPGLAT